jgi:hypothetical protein
MLAHSFLLSVISIIAPAIEKPAIAEDAMPIDKAPAIVSEQLTRPILEFGHGQTLTDE